MKQAILKLTISGQPKRIRGRRSGKRYLPAQRL